MIGAGYMIQNGREGGRELATGWSSLSLQSIMRKSSDRIHRTAASAALLVSSGMRFGKGPVPKALTGLGAASTAYYANQSYRWRVGY